MGNLGCINLKHHAAVIIIIITLWVAVRFTHDTLDGVIRWEDARNRRLLRGFGGNWVGYVRIRLHKTRG